MSEIIEDLGKTGVPFFRVPQPGVRLAPSLVRQFFRSTQFARGVNAAVGPGLMTCDPKPVHELILSLS
jgi:hypothetical protein